jgi:hypothetical protein
MVFADFLEYLLLCLHLISAIYSDKLLFDFSKALDMVSHAVLLSKLVEAVLTNLRIRVLGFR